MPERARRGFAADASFFTQQLYRSLARLTRCTAERYGIPLDREHIIGDDQVSGPTAAFQAGMHWDPGPYFDWAEFRAGVLNGSREISSECREQVEQLPEDPLAAEPQPCLPLPPAQRGRR